MRASSNDLNELAGALSAAQAEFVAIPKDSRNPFFKSSYAGLPKVVEVASPILTKHGLSVSQFIGTDETGADTLTTWLLHRSGQYIAESMRLHLTKPDAQGQGSATTYARRYSYMAVLGLVADDDDDGNRASQPPARSGRPAPTPAVPKVDLASRADQAELAKTAHGLTVGQIKMALTAVGVPHPEDPNALIFSTVPRDKLSALAATLAEMAREPA